MSYPLVASPLSHALGLALIRFVWQGAMLGAAGALLLLALRRASARLRYLTACLTLAAMVGTVAVTFAGLAREFSMPPPAVNEGAPSLTTIVAAPVATADITIGRTTALPTSAGWLDARYPWIVGVWAAGVLFFAVRLLRAWIMVQFVRRGARPIAAGWPDRIGAIRAALGVTRRVRVLESALVDVPSVIGWLRPIVLVPMSALAGLPPGTIRCRARPRAGARAPTRLSGESAPERGRDAALLSSGGVVDVAPDPARARTLLRRSRGVGVR